MHKLKQSKLLLGVVASILIVALSLVGVLRSSAPATPEASTPAPARAEARAALRAGPGPIGAGAQPADVPTAEAEQEAASRGEPAPEPAAQPPLKETRAVWVSRWDEWERPEDLQAMVNKVADANMNVIYFQVRGQADALYKSDLEPAAADLTGTLGQDPGWDPLAVLTESAHARGIEVHAWMNVYPVWMGKTAPRASAQPTPMYHEFNALYGQDWLQWDANGPMGLGGKDGYLFANPAHPAVQDRVVAVSKDLLERYELDGLHLDYIRYAGKDYSQDPVSNQAFEAARAADPGLSRADWQRAQVTALVQRIHDEALPVRPGAVLTTSAWPVYKDNWGWYKGNDGYNAFYQDSQGWTKQGIVSAINPMTYGMTLDPHLDRFQTLAQDYVAGSQPGTVVIGIKTDVASFDDVAVRIDVARQAGAAGQALFSVQGIEDHGFWSALRNGPYQEPAVPSWR